MDLRTLVQNTPSRGSASTWVAARSTPDGALYTASWLNALAIEGRVFVTNAGQSTTPLTFTAFSVNQPIFALRVPDATVLLLAHLLVDLEDVAGTDTEIIGEFTQNDIGNGTSAAATAGPISTRTDAPVTANVVARQLYTADATAGTNRMEFFRATYGIAEGTAGRGPTFVEWKVGDVGYSPVLVGTASVKAHVSATTTQATGFVIAVHAELPESSLAA